MNDRECVALLGWALPRLGHRWEGYRRVRRRVCRRIAARLRGLGLADAAAYRRRLEADPGEWAALQACLPVTVTRFCRDREVFRALAAVVLPALAQAALAAGGTALRAWSAGCANGEEPYSLGLLWRFGLQARFPGIRLEILATDIDAQVLQRAGTACYPESSLRELPGEWRQAAFSRQGGRYCLRPGYRAPVRFVRQDLAQEMPQGAFHLILCRNLAFTYFSEPRQRRIASQLAERLAPGGCLVLGSHERLPRGTAGLQPWPGARHCYRKAPGVWQSEQRRREMRPPIGE